MAVIDTGLIVKGVKSEFFDSFRARDKEALYQLLATTIQSTTNEEKYRWLGAIPRMREWGTGRLAKGLRAESYDVENLTYESTMEVDANEISDDQTGQIKIRTQQLAEAAATHKDFLLASLLNNGASAGFLAYDGKVFFAADHESGSSGAQSNLASQTVVDTADITTAEFKAGLKAAISRMMKLKDDRGSNANIEPKGLVVVVPPELFFTALEAVSATLINTTSNVLQGAATVRSLGDLSSATKAFVCKSDATLRPFIFQDREPIKLDALAEGSEIAFHKGVYQFGTRARYRLTYGEYRHAVQLTFTA